MLPEICWLSLLCSRSLGTKFQSDLCPLGSRNSGDQNHRKTAIHNQSETLRLGNKTAPIIACRFVLPPSTGPLLPSLRKLSKAFLAAPDVQHKNYWLCCLLGWIHAILSSFIPVEARKTGGRWLYSNVFSFSQDCFIMPLFDVAISVDLNLNRP